MTFLEWMLDSYRRIRKRSTVHAYKRVLFQVYRKSIGVDFNSKANEEINDYVNGYLTIRYKLDTSVNEKPLALLILLQAYTATRPRVLAHKKLS
ncbi:hypothetical protein NOR_07296 [Metarhizium rileyi]|uniref:Uncharacterized protein n=1 Tax=Metarhizium rileyi (strain RCEF 4871) TaxID=1649241 RepID=A0A166YL15_METRR|nr:hypothetical protein NOR_07296 [Metarhizium rileyi RCEF 4871]